MRVDEFKTYKASLVTIKTEIIDCCRYDSSPRLLPRIAEKRPGGPVNTKTYWCAQDKHHDCLWRSATNYAEYCACECHKLNEALNKFHESEDKLIEVKAEPIEPDEQFDESDETENDLCTALSIMDTLVWALKGIGQEMPTLPVDIETYASKALLDAEEFLAAFDQEGIPRGSKKP